MAVGQAERVSSRGISAVIRFLPAMLSGDFKFCEMMKCRVDDIDSLPPRIPSDDEIEFVKAVENATKSLQGSLRDWGATHEARELLTSIDAIGSADELRLMKLIALHVRADKMVRGHLEEAIRSGHITAILSRLDELHQRTREEIQIDMHSCN